MAMGMSAALGHRTMFTRAAGLVALFSKALDKNHLKERLMLLTQPTLFIIGEIGSIPIDCQGGESDFPADQPTGLAGLLPLTDSSSVGTWARSSGVP